MAQQGMLGSVFADPEDPFNTADAYRFAQIANPNYREGAFRRRQGENMVQAGVDQAVSAFTGGDKRQQAASALRDLAKTVKPGTKEFYQQAATILSTHGLVAEAAQMQEKYEAAMEAERTRGEREMGLGSTAGDIARLQKQRDALQTRMDAGDARVKPALDAIDRELAAKGTVKPGSLPASSDLGKMLAEQAKYPEGSPGWVAYQNKITPKTGEKPMTAAEKARDARETARDERKTAADEAKTEGANRAIVNAMKAMAETLSLEIDAAQKLHDSADLKYITGKWAGAAPDVASGAIGGNAMAFYLQVVGQTFMRALQDLKATSKTGASGLGQLTEREGDKIQNARVALSRQQDTEQFRETLLGYLNQLINARNAAEKELKSVGEAAARPKATGAKASPGSMQVDPAEQASRDERSAQIREGEKMAKPGEDPAAAAARNVRAAPKGKWKLKRVKE